MITYKIGIRIPLGKILPRAQEIDDSINENIQRFGFDEKVMITSILPFELKVPDEITKEDLAKCKQIVLDGMIKHFGWAKIESFVKG